MSLEDIRILEDLKSAYGDLSQKYGAMVDSEEKNLLRKTADEFADFFSNAKFNVQRSPAFISAKYGNFSAILDLSKPKGWMGVKIRLELAVSAASGESKFIVALNPDDFGPTISFNSPHKKTRTEEIEEYKAKIEATKAKIKSNSVGPYHLSAKLEKSSDPYKPYSSLTALLSEITN